MAVLLGPWCNDAVPGAPGPPGRRPRRPPPVRRRLRRPRSPELVAGREVAPARIWAGLLIIYVVWGSTYLGILLAIRTVPVFLLGAIRFLVAGSLLYAWAIRRGDRKGDRPGLRQWGAAAIVGTLLFLGGDAGVGWAEKRGPTGTASLVVATIPPWVALFDRIACGPGRSRLSAA